MSRSFVRGRVFPVVSFLYVAAIGLQIFFAGMYVFVGAANIELHRTFAHAFIVLSVLMFAAAFIGQVDGRAKRLTFGLFGLLVLQGMLVHVGQWFGLSMIAALHPVNAILMAYVSVTLARHALTMWSARTDVAAAPASVTLQPAS
jgi:hypothetical protein